MVFASIAVIVAVVLPMLIFVAIGVVVLVVSGPLVGTGMIVQNLLVGVFGTLFPQRPQTRLCFLLG